MVRGVWNMKITQINRDVCKQLRVDMNEAIRSKLEEYGLEGHEFVKSDDAMQSAIWMCKNFSDHMNTAFEKWKPRKRYSIYKA